MVLRFIKNKKLYINKLADWEEILSGIESYDIRSEKDFDVCEVAALAQDVIYVGSNGKRFKRLIRDSGWVNGNCLVVQRLNEDVDDIPKIILWNEEIRFHFYEIITENVEIEKFIKIGELRYLAEINTQRYLNASSYLNQCLERFRDISDQDPDKKAFKGKEVTLNRYIRNLTNWFVDRRLMVPDTNQNNSTKRQKSEKWRGTLSSLAILAVEKAAKNNWTNIQAYKWAAERYTIKEKHPTAEQLKRAYYKKRSM